MKKRIAEVLRTSISALGIMLTLCACGNSASESNNTNSGNSTLAASDNSENSAGEGEPGIGIGTETGTEAGTTQNNSLSLLYNLQYGKTACVSDKGYYYLSDDLVSLSDGRLANHLMYIDFASRQEIYLCSNAACSHNTADCTSVLLKLSQSAGL